MAATSEPDQLNILCRGVRLEQVEMFKNLGSVIDQTVDCIHETKAKPGAARSSLCSLSHLWKDRALNKTIKLKLLTTDRRTSHTHTHNYN